MSHKRHECCGRMNMGLSKYGVHPQIWRFDGENDDQSLREHNFFRRGHDSSLSATLYAGESCEQGRLPD